jgi:FAD/FMN-containing dehydrogenase/SAM-dependent methyltransferase
MNAERLIVNDVTRLNPVAVWAIATPTSIEEVQEAMRRTDVPISVGGGHFSMGGQTASPGSLHLDMRRMNKILHLGPEAKTIRVQAGVRWCDIQKFVDPHGLAVKIMQTYANFTVGGSLSVNVHGRYVGLGPLILSVRAISLVLPDGSLVEATPKQHSELFYAAIGAYGAIGVIVEAELELAENTRVERVHANLPTGKYAQYFREKVRSSSTAVFHNADIYAPHYKRVRAVTWQQTKRPATVAHHLQKNRRMYPLHLYFLWAMSETPFGKWRREFFIDPLVYLSKPVHWRNFEAGYDVAELEPPSRKHRTYVLQEYFVPVERFDEFVPKIAEILQRHRVNALNISVRHALADPGSLMAWARGETFAFVLYYKQRTRENAKNRVAVWTRELIEAVLSVGGTYYLPYQPHATLEQFHRAYPGARQLFALKRKLDPEYRLRNSLWDKYYAPPAVTKARQGSEFHAVFGEDKWQDGFYRFLQNVYRIYPEDRFHTLIREACAKHHDDEKIYRYLQEHLPTIKPPLADLTYALPSLFKQKKEMVRQALELLGERREFNGYMEIGSTGRYVAGLRANLKLRGPVILVNDIAPSNSPIDVVERGGLRKVGQFVPMADYAPIDAQAVPDESLDFVSCYIGLHHIHPSRLEGFIKSIRRVLRPGGVFILRDHDVKTPEMFTFVSLVHTVFNAGLGVPWETNQQELRYFAPVSDWVQRLRSVGLMDSGKRLLQANDPSDNVLMSFVREG